MSRAHRRERRPRRRSGFEAAAIFSLSSETHLPLWVFPSARKECTRKPEKKSEKQDITAAERRKFQQERTKGSSQGLARKEKTAPGCRTNILLVRHAGCGGG